MFEFKADISSYPCGRSSTTITGCSITDVLRQAKYLAIELKDILKTRCTVSVLIGHMVFVKDSDPELVPKPEA